MTRRQPHIDTAADAAISTDLLLRPATVADAEACGVICYAAFKTIAEQHRFPPDFPAPEAAAELLSDLFARDDVYTVVAELNGRAVGSNALWENAVIAGVGPITVDPAVQNGAVGRRLMEAVLRRAQEQSFVGVRLVQAAYHNRSLSLYSKLGFDVREPLSILQGPPMGIRIPGLRVRAIAQADLEACNSLCRRVHGHYRERELADAVARGTATLVARAGRVTGYTTDIGFFGHTVGESNEDLKALIGAARAFAGPGFLLPSRNAELLRWCLARRLRIVQPMTLMSKGLYNTPLGAFLPSIIY